MEDEFGSVENVVFMDNLKKDRKNKTLAISIHNLFTVCLKIPLPVKDIKIIQSGDRGTKFKHALINLQSENYIEKACNILGSLEKRSQLKFDFLQIVDLSVNLIVYRKPSGVNNTVENGQNKRNKVEHRWESPKVDSDTDKRDNTTSVGLGIKEIAQKISGSTSKTDEQRFYEEDELLGNETRNKEFKEGGGEYYVKKNLKEHVAKYMCGFLNSSQQGTLFIGVKDNGSVVGIECNQTKENDIRLTIDQTVNTITPKLFPQNYYVAFVPVYKDGQVKADFKVVEITVDNVNNDNPTDLYMAAGKAYIRYDGSVYQLKPSEIHEWSKQNNEKQMQKALKKQEDDLNRQFEMEKNKALKKLEDDLNRQSEMETKKALKKQEDDLNRQTEMEKNKAQRKLEDDEKEKKIHHLQTQNKEMKTKISSKSKACVVM